jgi:hypothetical protein
VGAQTVIRFLLQGERCRVAGAIIITPAQMSKGNDTPGAEDERDQLRDRFE